MIQSWLDSLAPAHKDAIEQAVSALMTIQASGDTMLHMLATRLTTLETRMRDVEARQDNIEHIVIDMLGTIRAYDDRIARLESIISEMQELDIAVSLDSIEYTTTTAA